MNYRQKNWPKWLVTAEFAVNNKVHLVTKVLPFITNYRRKLRMGINTRRKEKVEKITKFVKRMKKVQEEVEAVLKKAQKEMKRQAVREEKKLKNKINHILVYISLTRWYLLIHSNYDYQL